MARIDTRMLRWGLLKQSPCRSSDDTLPRPRADLLLCQPRRSAAMSSATAKVCWPSTVSGADWLTGFRCASRTTGGPGADSRSANLREGDAHTKELACIPTLRQVLSLIDSDRDRIRRQRLSLCLVWANPSLRSISEFQSDRAARERKSFSDAVCKVSQVGWGCQPGIIHKETEPGGSRPGLGCIVDFQSLPGDFGASRVSSGASSGISDSSSTDQWGSLSPKSLLQ